jgi:hypothetical protein
MAPITSSTTTKASRSMPTTLHQNRFLSHNSKQRIDDRGQRYLRTIGERTASTIDQTRDFTSAAAARLATALEQANRLHGRHPTTRSQLHPRPKNCSRRSRNSSPNWLAPPSQAAPIRHAQMGSHTKTHSRARHFNLANKFDP